MLDINFIRKNSDKVKKAAQDKGVKVDIEKLIKLDKERNQHIKELDDLKAHRNKLSKKKPGPEAIDELKLLKGKIKDLEVLLRELEQDFYKIMGQIPNIPADDVKIGKDESDNEVIKTVGKPTKFSFKPKDYMEVGESLELIDTKRAAKVSGTRFGYLKNEAVLLEFALWQYTFETLVKEGFKPILPPYLIKDESMQAMGYLEHGEDQETYHLEKDKLYLIGTSEQAIGPFHQDEILNGQDLPLRYVGFSTCFRREAGSYGKDTKGILRVHQFDKVEMFSFTKPENSDQEHEYLLSLEEKMVQDLKLPYQIVKMCTGDLGNPAARKYDIETWIPSENKYRETHSTSTCTDFQARRLNIRFRNPQTNKNEFVHTLNGTGFAFGRTFIAILENYQGKDGSVEVPKVLHKHLNFKKIGLKK